MNILKTFYKPKQRAVLRKLFNLSLPPPLPEQMKQIKSLTSLEQKNSDGDIQKYTEIFFLTPNIKMFVGKFVKWERFLAVCFANIFSMSNELN